MAIAFQGKSKLTSRKIARSIARQKPDVAADRPSHTGMTATAAATKLRNATLNGKHATPPPTGMPEHHKSARISRKLEWKSTIKGGGTKSHAGNVST